MGTCEETYESIQELIANDNHAAAIAALEDLVEEFRDHAAAHFDLGNLYYACGRKQKALAHYETTVALAPQKCSYLKNLADLLHTEYKAIDRAMALYRRIVAIQPDDVQTLMIMGHLCVSRERFEDAVGYYNQVLDIEPWNDEAQQFVDQIAGRDGGLDEDEDPETTYLRCQEMVNSGQTNQAVAALEALIARHPAFALAHNDLGVLYYQRGEKHRCLQQYENALAIEPDNANFKKNMADFYLAERGDVEKALEIYLAVLTENPEDIDALMVAGHICAAIGKNNSAKTFYDRVLDVEPWNIDASDRLEQLQGIPS